ncbi:hypothetical protein IEQ34_007849 [Dendrobium chrysotoxum]|uniref:Uncharacterized protein n=1 Tax=Dendrobium chrysotoxum TaxID=161865 RepID=A0AAV7H4M1_DENCH|nr:hypothetical protein IEQ34_007849 [Dendrobium chrysotoxum]
MLEEDLIKPSNLLSKLFPTWVCFQQLRENLSQGNFHKSFLYGVHNGTHLCFLHVLGQFYLILPVLKLIEHIIRVIDVIS